MNKYEKALNDLADIVGKMGNINIKTLKTYKILKELVERATPMKVRLQHLEDANRDYVFCPICDNGIGVIEFVKAVNIKYCPECGQALDWSE